MIKSYLKNEKVELWIFADNSMSRNIANTTDKLEILISTEKEGGKRFETTYKDLLNILETADNKLSQSMKS